LQGRALKNWRIVEIVVQMIDALCSLKIFGRRFGVVFMLVSLAISLVLLRMAFSAVNETPRVEAVRIAGPINPVVAEFVTDQLARVNLENADAFLLELDTPGGLDSAMRQIIKGILGSNIPVIVFVSPAGARAASAGALITLSADFAVMAPGTNIGAAHPVSIGGGQKASDDVMMNKVIEDAAAYARSLAARRGRDASWAEKMVRESVSISATEALRYGIVDVVADNFDDLFQKLHGRNYQRGDVARKLSCKGAVVEWTAMDWRQKILNAVSDPNVAYMLLMLGILGVFFEISQPGVILPGAVGGISLLLAVFAFQALPVNYVGILLILLALVLFVLEVKVTSFGMLTIGGVVSMTLGSLMLFEHAEPFFRVSKALVACTVIVVSGLCLLVLYYVVRAQRRRFVSGREGMAGLTGEALTEVHQSGQVFVHGEYWKAFSVEPIARGESIVVVRMVDNMRLQVRRANSLPLEEAAYPMSGSEKEDGK
jgi:membrane-bound serine protease (ClpP class)